MTEEKVERTAPGRRWIAPEPGFSGSAVWKDVCAEIGATVGSLAAAVGANLREGGIEWVRRPDQGLIGVGILSVGRSRYRFECPFEAAPIRFHERILRRVFGDAVPVVRLYVYREAGEHDEFESWFVIEPRSRRWIASAPDGSTTGLREPGELENHLLELVFDRGDS